MTYLFHLILFVFFTFPLFSQKLPTEIPKSHHKMIQTLKRIADQTTENNPYLGSIRVKQLQRELYELPLDTPVRRKWELTFQLAQAELNLGLESKAIQHFTQSLSIIQQNGHPSVIVGTQFYLAVAHMRQAETENCCLQHKADSCILPLQEHTIHTQKEPARQAIRYLTKVLEMGQDNNPFYFKALWLLNIAYMTIGEYPESIPVDWQIPTQTFVSEETIPRFRNIAPELGLDVFDLSGGAVADDFNNDGYVDLLTSTWDPSGQIRFFSNNGDGTFSDQTEIVGLTGILGGLNLVQADYDNDGDLDVLVLRGAWLGANGQHPNSLLQNNLQAKIITFTDVTFSAGLGDVHYPTQTASWADYDNDGDLDLYVGNECNQLLPDAPNQLFRNNGNGTFKDVASIAGVQDYGPTKAVIWGDYNNDCWPDIYVSNLGDANRLYHNNGNGTFEDRAGELGVMGYEETFPAWFWDVNNDGILDLYVASYIADIGILAADAKNLGVPAEALPQLYQGTDSGWFEDVTDQFHLLHPTAPMGSNFGDFDNDGFLDFYLGTGNPDLWNIMPGMMYRNQGGNKFSEVSYSGGFAHLQKGHAVCFADFDNDGDQDIFEQMGGAFPADRYNNVLYQNDGFGNNWLTVQLIGTVSNRSAIGARVHLKIVENGRPRSIFKHVNSGGTFGANPLRQTIGVGQAKVVEKLEIFWPTTGQTQAFSQVPVCQFIRIIEEKSQWELIPMQVK